MAKEPILGWIHEPLAAIVGTRGKVAVLRILWRASNPLAYREVVRRSGMAYRSIDLALGELTETGIVEELEGGHERRVRFRTGHRLAAAISSLLQVEADFFASLRVELRTIGTASLGGGLLAAALVGAAARREERLGGSLDLLLIASDPRAATRCRERFDLAADAIRSRFGVKLNLLVYDVATARAMWRTRTAAAIRDVSDAQLLAGTPLMELLSS
jgi:DNA-binding transcriptional ArsR family regulator